MDKKWQEIIDIEKSKYYFKSLDSKLFECNNNNTLCPEYRQIFSAFEMTPFDKVKVVIIGQDPYHGEKQANGLAFSVNKNQTMPKSLKNIFKELSTDLNIKEPLHGDLSAWANQGVLLLNRILTVELNKPLSHKNIGWEFFTQEVLVNLAKDNRPKVFVLWGNEAQKIAKLISSEKHLIIKSPHPSPLSAYNGFFGSKPFSKINQFLIKNKLSPINWDIK